MSALRLRLACGACRVCRALLRLLGRGGTSLPGRLARRICPELLARLAEGKRVVLVSGTNGKTTVTALLRHMADAQGLAYISNPSGANLADGLAAAFACGKRECALALIECDEGTLPLAAAALHPAVIVVTNLFRDQLDRYGEITAARDKLRQGIECAPEAVLCLNADCSLSATLGLDVPNRVEYFGLDGTAAGAVSAVSDAPRCLRCGGEYLYRSRSFAHLGDWYCPHCGESRPALDWRATQLQPLADGGSRFEVEHGGAQRGWELSLPALYNVYNALAALCVAQALGWDGEAAGCALADAAPPFGRMERFTLEGTPVQLLLAKNPAGLDRVLEYLAALPGEIFPVFCLNDRYADGTDISWIWDADFESFAARGHFTRVGVYGRRREELRLRLKYALAEDGRVESYGSLRALVAAAESSGTPVYVAANYTAMLAVRDALATAAGRERWESGAWK